MRRFPGFLEEFRHLKHGLSVDRVLVVCDADNKEPQGLQRAMEARIAQRTYAFSPVRFVVIVQELETWLLADAAAFTAVTHRGVAAVNETLEAITDPKLRLQRLLADAGAGYTPEVARKIAAAIESRSSHTVVQAFAVFNKSCKRIEPFPGETPGC